MEEEKKENLSGEKETHIPSAFPAIKTEETQEESIFDVLSRETEEAWQEQLVVPDEGSAEKTEQDHPGSKRTVKVFCHECQQKLDVTNLRPFSMIRCPSCGEKLLVPKWFDTYLLEEPGGSGGMAQVYRALDITLDREVAIKILKDDIRHDSVQAKRFLHEARLAAILNHCSVIPIYTCGVFEGQTYMVMQYMPGGSLESRIPAEGQEFPDLRETLRYFHDIAEGLEHAAGSGIIHHDVKPGNILLDGEGNVKIGDFGLAQSAADPEDSSDVPEEEWITPHYVSPERISSGKEDFRGDIYSLGATFYHLLCGRPPFEHENLEELIWMRTRQKAAEPILLRKDLPRSISNLIMRMLHIDPGTRPSYRQIITELENVLSDNRDGSFVLQRDFPLPKAPGEIPVQPENLPAGSSVHRVKAPSAILKNKPVPSPVPPGKQEEEEGVSGGKRVQKNLSVKDLWKNLQKDPGDSPGPAMFFLMGGMLLLAILTLAFLLYGILEFMQAGL